MAPIYMDLHIVPGITAEGVAKVHMEDVKIQDQFGCRCMTYWVDEERGSAFCLIDAPNKEAVRNMHDRAHGLLPHEIIQVNSKVVEAFLGRIQDPETFNDLADPDIKIFNDPAFRIIMVTDSFDSAITEISLGKNKALELLALHNDTIRDDLRNFEGREVVLERSGFVASFVSVTQAVECALSIRKKLHVAAELMGLRISLHAGVPVKENDLLFGATLKFADNLCHIAIPGEIIISNLIRDLYKADHQRMLSEGDKIKWLTPSEENFLELLMNALEEHWNDPEFSVDDFSRIMTTSKSQLYRKSISVTGKSPNNLLRDYRLLKSLNLLKRQDRNIAETTFDSGFSSPSYFAKCFQKKFGLQPMAYLKMQA